MDGGEDLGVIVATQRTSAICPEAVIRPSRIALRAIGSVPGATAATRRTTADCRAAIIDKSARFDRAVSDHDAGTLPGGPRHLPVIEKQHQGARSLP